MSMVDASRYSASETLRDGLAVTVRAVRPDNREGLIEAFHRASPKSLYRRFFSAKKSLSEKEISFFLDVDFINHVALVAVATESGREVIVAGGRFIVVQPGQAEVAFTVLDQYHGRGLGTILMRHLVILARGVALKQLVAEVLPENTPMLKVFEKCGLPMQVRHERGVVHITLQVSPL